MELLRVYSYLFVKDQTLSKEARCVCVCARARACLCPCLCLKQRAPGVVVEDHMVKVKVDVM